MFDWIVQSKIRRAWGTVRDALSNVRKLVEGLAVRQRDLTQSLAELEAERERLSTRAE